jgi:hypothetical protein
MDPDVKFVPPMHEPSYEEKYVDNNLVIVTNILQAALDFFSGYQPRLHVVVDNEADRGYTNALTIFIPQARKVLLFHGPRVHMDQFHVYERLERLGATCYSWGSNMEADYPNLVDIQARRALLSRTQHYQGQALSKVAKELGLPRKEDCDDFAIYTQNVLPHQAVVYAVRDVTLPEIIRHAFAPSVGYQTVVRCGQMDYRLPPP